MNPRAAASNVLHPIRDTKLSVGQYVARHSVGVYLTGRRGESSQAVASRIDPFLAPLRDALEDEEFADDWWGSASVLRTDTSDRDNWDRATDWLHERRLTYEEVLREDSG